MSLSSNIYSLYKSVFHFISNIIEVEQKIDSTEAITRIEQEVIYADGIDRKALWGRFSREPISDIHFSLKKVVSQFEKEGVRDKTALDLGCGKAISTLYLLEKGWNVQAVDYSQEALDNLQKVANGINREWIQKRQLTLICRDIENYDFPKNITIIIASRTLPYLNPLKISALWDRLYDSLAQGGRILGHFFPRQAISSFELGHRALMGVWFTDIASVQSLLNQKNYQIEACEYSDFWFRFTRNIEFIGKKQKHPLNKKRLFSIHLSSYFDAVRGLPSKGLFPHFYPFVADRLIELRELSKLTIFVSGAIALTKALLQFDVTIASYTFTGSISAWFIFRQFAEGIRNKALIHIKNARSVNYKNSEELSVVIQKIQQIQSRKNIKNLLNPPPPKYPIGQTKRVL